MGIWNSIKNWIMSILAGTIGMIGVYFYGRKSGSLQEAQRQQEKDLETAKKVEDSADRIRRDINNDDDPVKRLSEYGKLRDKP